MPSVNSQNIITVLPQYINIIRGQQWNATITLHKNYVGNTIDIGASTNVIVEYVNSNNTIFKTQSKSGGNLIYGGSNTDNKNKISLSLSGTETLGLPLEDNNVNGEVLIRVKVTQQISEVTLPLLKVGNIYDAGDQIGDVVASRYSIPSTVYSVKHAGVNYNNTTPAQGELVFNSDIPSQISRFKIALK